MIAVTRLMALVIGYFCGCFPSGYLVGKSRGVDIRKHGSGNTGATNTLRTLGWGPAALTFFGDCMKTILAIVLANVLFHRSGFDMTILQLYAGLGAVLGHNFPFYFKFKGGKGIACTAGVAFALFPAAVPVCFIVFVLCIAFKSPHLSIFIGFSIIIFSARGFDKRGNILSKQYEILVILLFFC